MAAWSGLSPDEVANLDDDVFGAFRAAVLERNRLREWGSLHELLASVVEALWGVRGRLEAGIPAALVNGLGSVEAPRYPRPSWFDSSSADDVPVISPRQLARSTRKA